MGTVPFALSVHSFINSVGADAGFAAIIGLAILVLLYFAQARETATLRERLDDAAGRLAAAESRLLGLQRAQAQSTQVPVTPAPAMAARPLSAAGAVAGSAGAVAGGAAVGEAQRARTEFVGAPAGMAAPALTAATKLIPTPVPAVAGAGAGAAGMAGTGAKPAAIPRPVTAGVVGASDDTILVPSPATAAAGANGHSDMGTTTPAPVAPAPRPQIRPGAPPPPPSAPSRRPPGSTRPTATRSPSRARRLLPGLIGLGAVAVIVAALLIITGGSTTKTPVTHPSNIARTRTKRPVPFDPAHVRVAVLNGTAVFDLAKNVGLKLTGVGYDVPSSTVENAAEQTATTTTIGYLPGFQADAKQVAKALKLSLSDVQPAGSQATAVVCPNVSAAAPCPANVIVTIGTDMAGAATSS